MKSGVFFAVLLLVAASTLSCEDPGPQQTVTLVFPDAETRRESTSLTVAVFEPIDPNGFPRFRSCEHVGHFSPERSVNVVSLKNRGQLARSGEFERTDGFDYEIGLPRLTETAQNPWGALVVHLTAMGPVTRTPRSRPDAFDGPYAETCYCIRTLEGSHDDPELDAEVKQACPLETESANRVLTLEPIVSSAFRLEPCGTDGVTGVADTQMNPGPVACLRVNLCSEGLGEDCFPCESGCSELNSLSNVTVQFELEGGGVSSQSIRTLTNSEGRAEARFQLDGCTGDYDIRASIMGRFDEQISFSGTCVSPVGAYSCQGEFPMVLQDQESIRGLTTLPVAQNGNADNVAVMSQTAQGGTLIRVLSMAQGRAEVVDELNLAEGPASILGFYFELNENGPDQRPMLAVATSSGLSVRVRVYAWDGQVLTLVSSLFEPCSQWSCGSLRPCEDGCGEAEVCSEADLGRCVLQGAGQCSLVAGCECQLELNPSSKIILNAADRNGDGRADLMIANSSDTPINTWFSQSSNQASPYVPTSCRCGQYTTRPLDTVFPRLGGEGPLSGPETADLILGSSSGTLVVYAREISNQPVLQCGVPGRFGDIRTIRDLAVGRLSCQRGDPSCRGFEDVIVLASERLDGGVINDSGRLQIVLGGEVDIRLLEDVYDTPGRHIGLYNDFSSLDDPRQIAVGDLNGDQHDDFAVLYADPPSIRGWLGKSNRGIAEMGEPLSIVTCPAGSAGEVECSPLDQFILPDIDGNGRADVVVVCDPSANMSLLRWFVSSP